MRLRPMLTRMFATTVLSAVAIHLSGCDRTGRAPDSGAAPAAVATGESGSAPAPANAPPGPDTRSGPIAPSTSRDPQEVLLSWAKAVSLRDWATAYGYWGDQGARSGMTLDEVRAEWGTLQQPDLEIGEGRQEGAAGSLYYAVPVTIVDGTRRIPGEVVLKRVNDVEGAGPEQLRWHIDSTTLRP